MRTTCLLVALVAVHAARAEVITWTNTSSGWWHVAANWSPNLAPSTNDVAVITNAGTYTVSLFQPITIAGLTLGGESGTQTLSTAEQALRLEGGGNVGEHGVFRLALGSLSGSGQLSVAGTFAWDGGTIDTNAAVTIASGGQMLIGPGANFARVLYGAITNAGTITWATSGWIHFGGVLHNLSGGLFDAQWSAPMTKLSGTARFINDGVFRKSASAGTLDCAVPFINRGTVDTQAGKLTLPDGSVFHDGCNFIGAGETHLSNGTNTIAGNIQCANLWLLYSATLAGTGSFSGTLAWGGGNIGPGAALTIATNGELRLGGGNFAKFLYGNLTNAGRITWQPSGGLVIGGWLHNLPGAIFDAQMDGAISQGGNGAIFNDGVFRKSAGALSVDVNVPLINNGSVETQTGRLLLGGGSVFNSGCEFTGAGETWMNNGTNTIHGIVHSENLMLFYSATLTGTGSFNGTLTWGGGNIGPGAALTIATNGELRLGGGTFTKFLYGHLTNTGTIIYQPAGSLAIGGALHNFGLFDAQINGRLYTLGGGAVFINDGTFQRSLVAGSTVCEPPFVNRGTVRVPLGTLSFEGSYTNPIGTIEVCGGTFRLFEPLWLPGGLVTGWGTVIADVTNAACIRPSCSNGVLTISGKFEQLLGGRLEFDLAGNTPGANQSRLNITGTATLRGTVGVRWDEGFEASPGTNFPVMTFASRKGEFCCFDNFILLGQGRRLTTTYGTTSVTLATVAAPEPTSLPFRITVDGGALVCWPVEFSGYELYWSTNFSETNWTLLPGATNRWLESPPLAPEKFFRLMAD